MATKPKYKKFDESDAHGAASKFGQLIGQAFAGAVVNCIEAYLERLHKDQYKLLEPDEGKKLVRMKMFGGTSRQMDNVIVPAHSIDPVALFESKWLKDARHHNDKGAWILQLKEIRKKYPTVRGAVAILAGYWTSGVGVMFETEAGVETVLVATDQQVYQTLQTEINNVLNTLGLAAIDLSDTAAIRNTLPRSWDLANVLQQLEQSGALATIAGNWFGFEDEQGNNGITRVENAIASLLSPLPETVRVVKLELAFQIETGNTIYHEVSDMEEARELMDLYFANPAEILKIITPRKTNDPVIPDDIEMDASADSPI